MKERLDPIEFARMRRNAADDWERFMWQMVRNRQRCNQKFRRDVEAKLNVDVDGASHQSKKAKTYDAARDRWMKNQGIRVLRFYLCPSRT